jgi:nucleoid-associated protein YgaU
MPEAHGPAAPAADTMPESSHTAPTPATDTQVAQANTNLPPIGATPRIQSPPIPLPNTSVAHALAPVQPQVVTFDEESYRTGPGDTFQSISEKFYHSKVYDQALLLFNRDHPMSAGTGANPQPGQTIFIPPLSILEERYPQTLPTLTPVKPAAAPARTGAAGVPATVASYATTYQVPTAGMSFYQVAQHALGSGERWGEIYRLNPQYSPQGPLPAGSILRMPPPSGLAPTATR